MCSLQQFVADDERQVGTDVGSKRAENCELRAAS